MGDIDVVHTETQTAELVDNGDDSMDAINMVDASSNSDQSEIVRQSVAMSGEYTSASVGKKSALKSQPPKPISEDGNEDDSGTELGKNDFN